MNAPRKSSNSDYLLKLRDEVLQAPIEVVPLQDLTVGHSPRLSGENAEYTRALADTQAALPPILVHRSTMRVIDGIHRLRVASQRGQTHIQVRFFEGDDDDSHLLAIAINVAHGLPLSMEERSAAVERILGTHPHWSDRAVAAVAGLSAKKTADIRRQLLGSTTAGDTRVGRDGRARPIDPAHGREIASSLLKNNPDASLRQIARQAGISPATVSDVRDRMRRGESPIPAKQQRHIRLAHAAERTRPAAAQPLSPTTTPTELISIFESLRRDPSLRLNDTGRAILRMLDACTAFARNREDIAASLPPHCKSAMAQLAQGYAHTWQQFASELQHGDLPLEKAG